MNFVNFFFQRLIKDFNQKELMPLKMLFFIHASTLFVLYPYLTIHMRELGINVEETAIMSAVTPVVSILMPPIAGMIADKIGNFKILLSLFSTLGGGAALLLLLVPVGRVTIKYPEQIILRTSCNMQQFDGNMFLSIHDGYPCDKPNVQNISVTADIQTCGLVCQSNEYLFNSTNYEVNIGNNKYSYTFNKTPETLIRKISNNVYFFPVNEVGNFNCDFNNKSTNYQCQISKKPWNNTGSINMEVAPQRKTKGIYDFRVTSLNYDNKKSNVTCSNAFQQDRENISVEISNSFLQPCVSTCILAVKRKDLCSNMKRVKELDISLTFWSYLSVRLFIGIISGTAFAMFEGAVIAILREHKADYGLQRIYATIGGMISSPLSGVLIDYASQGKGYTDFRPAFYLYAALKIIGGLLMLTINLEFKSPAKSVVTDVINVMRKIELILLFVVCFVLGTAWGYIESFLFWLLQDLGASRSLMGVTITVGGIAGIPLLVFSGPIIERIGHANVIFIGFIFYAIRLMGYSLIYNPWLCLVFEAMEGVTSSLTFTAAVTYAAKLSTTTTDTSVQGLLGGIYYGVGKGSGSLIGGYLIKLVGTRPTYQIFSYLVGIIGILYFMLNKFYLQKLPRHNDHDIHKGISKPTDFADTDVKKNDKYIVPNLKVSNFDEKIVENTKNNLESKLEKQIVIPPENLNNDVELNSSENEYKSSPTNVGNVNYGYESMEKE